MHESGKYKFRIELLLIMRKGLGRDIEGVPFVCIVCFFSSPVLQTSPLPRHFLDCLTLVGPSVRIQTTPLFTFVAPILPIGAL